MHSDPASKALRDIASNIALARSFVAGFTYSQFQADRRTVYAVIRCLEIISEASRRLADDVKERHPNIEWNQVAASGNFYRHIYQDVRDDIIWTTVQQSLEPLLVAMESELRRTD
jgi:uncharacterized protein with HEPN domain